jgi:uncharacterized protein YbjT (DUF2867 family)
VGGEKVSATRRVLLMGGGGGVVGSGVLGELAGRFAITSYHRSPVPAEQGRVRFVPGDLQETSRFPDLVKGVGAIVNVVWYREPGPDRLFVRTAAALDALVQTAQNAGVQRFVQISLPPAPEALETRTPYLKRKREFESRLVRSGLEVTLVQPDAIFARHDRLVTVMMDLLRRHQHFPFWGDGSFHVAPIWHRDVGWLVGEALEGRLRGTVLAGGPERMTYAGLLDLLQEAVGRRAKLVHVSVPTARTVIRLFNAGGWHVLYTYEFDWLVSNMLGLPPAPHEGRELKRLADFLKETSAREN